MNFLKIIKRLLGLTKLKLPRIFKKLKFPTFKLSTSLFFKKWYKLPIYQKDLITELLNRDRAIQKIVEKELDKTLKTILQKDIKNVPLSTVEKNFLEKYKELFLKKKRPIYSNNRIFAISESSWITNVIYYPMTKQVRLFISNKNGVKKWYTFYNVPKTKYLSLVKLGGKYMWDYFGKHYSLNPRHWIRESEVGKVRVRKYYAKRK